MRQTRQEIIDAAVIALEHFLARGGMYIAPRDIRHTVSFLSGFNIAIAAAGINFVNDAHFIVWAERGWKFSNRGPTEDMEAKGLDVEAVIRELVEIEITILRQHTVYTE